MPQQVPAPMPSRLVPPISYKNAVRMIGTMPTLRPRPTSTNIRTLTTYLSDRITSIPSYQSPEFGYMGMVKEKIVYALTGADPWVEFNNPGAFRDRTDGTASTVQQKDAEAICLAHKKIFDSQTNVRRAVIDTLNLAVPREYKRYNTSTYIGAKIYKANSDPGKIPDALRYNYGKVQPSEKTRNDILFNASWVASSPIESLFDRLEACFVFAMITRPPYT